MSGPALRDAIAGMRAEAKHHREQARRLRLLKQSPKLGPVERLKIGFQVTERVQAAKACDRRAREIRERQSI